MSAASVQIVRDLSDPLWRLANLYKIITKDEHEDAAGNMSKVVQFVPNWAQADFNGAIHFRNLILKARQLGFTTDITIIWLDHALFVANQRCGIIAHEAEAAEVIFRDKVRFAYDNLDRTLRDAMPLKKQTQKELVFGHNNSGIRVATSMRSGTIDRLHISEFGKICKKYPEKAVEIMTGSIPAVPLETGILIIESTAEGDEGDFYNLVKRAMDQKKPDEALTKRDYKLHFYPWWSEPTYRMPAHNVSITFKDHGYFDAVEGEADTVLDMEQRAWYVATRDADYPDNPERMWQEYPSTETEAFQTSFDGKYYAKQIATMRKDGRVLDIPVLDVPVNTFWDIGNSDGCAIWFHQQIGMEDRFINYYEAHGEDLREYVKQLKKTGFLFNKHFLPHDADHHRLSDDNRSTEEMLNDLGVTDTEIVPRIDNLNNGILLVRKHLKSCFFDKTGCDTEREGDGEGQRPGLVRLANYKKTWNPRDGRWREDLPNKQDGNSEGADAFRQFAQAKEEGLITIKGKAATRRGTRAPVDWRTG